MRIPTNKEWDNLRKVTGGDDAVMHWDKMYSWVNDTEGKCDIPSGMRVYHGYFSARCYFYSSASTRSVHVGFRPAFDTLPIDPLPSAWGEGESRVIGTLYMKGEPVKVPQCPTYDGDIQDYIPGATLEIKEPLEDPAYQVKAIKVGDVYIADRNLLKYISYEDITGCIQESGDKAPSAARQIHITLSETAKKLMEEGKFQVPSYATAGSAAMDLRACVEHPVEVIPGTADSMCRTLPAVCGCKTVSIPTGVSMEIPEGYVGLVFIRSGMAFKRGLRLVNSVGVIDSDYRGEIMVGLQNTTDHIVSIEPGERIAQIMLVPIQQFMPVVVDTLSDTERGAGGFGSTGKV